MIITGRRLKAYAQLRIEELLAEADGKTATEQAPTQAAIGELVRLVHALDDRTAQQAKKNKRNKKLN